MFVNTRRQLGKLFCFFALSTRKKTVMPFFFSGSTFLRFFAGKKCLRTSFFFSFNSLLLLTQRNLEIENSEKRKVDHFETFFSQTCIEKHPLFLQNIFQTIFFCFASNTREFGSGKDYSVANADPRK